MTLTPASFADFWRGVHQRGVNEAPFPWQQRLVDEICQTGRWPDVIDVPTGLGKTTTLDIAVFTLALSLSGSVNVTLPRRIFMVIDRRVVVDQSYEHAQALGEALAKAVTEEGVVGEVARALRPSPLGRVEEHDPPLVVGRMRGGITWSWRWLERPDQPAVVIGTVDQLGSRLLFNGYGLGQTLQPLDAALTGTDSLVLVDEAHLATPFLRTVADAHQMTAPQDPLPVPTASVVVMSATAHVAEDAERLSASPTSEAASHVALRRLHAPKTLTTVEVPTTKAKRVAQMAASLADLAIQKGQPGAVVGVVVNTVDVARATFDAIAAQRGINEGQVLLLTGRQRRIDREPLWARWAPLITVGRPAPDQPLFVVATQTIEVGADLDFSALVTESCSLDALTQRLGRLNRVGRWEHAPALVVHPLGLGDDPIYGPARARTWEWLCELVTPQPVRRGQVIDTTLGIDVSPAALRTLHESIDTTPLRLPPPLTPVLFPGVLERWVRTWPRAMDTPPVAPFLHGFDRAVPTVTLLWRWARTGTDAVSDLTSSLTMLPPSPDETIDVPLWAAQAWLDGDAPPFAGLSDTEEVADPSALDGPRRTPPNPKTVAVELPSDGSPPRELARLRPNTVVALPTWAGGLDAFGWAPDSVTPVIDVADLATHSVSAPGGRRGRRAVLRIGVGTLQSFISGSAWLKQELETLAAAHEDGSAPLKDLVEPLLIGIADRIRDTPYRAQFAAVVEAVSARSHATWVFETPDDGHGDVREVPYVLLDAKGTLNSWTSDASATATSQSRHRVLLESHGESVAARAEAFARSLHLPPGLVDAVGQAGRWHDVGKLDPRFQRMLTGGTFLPPEPLAKSASSDFVGIESFERARRAADYPAGMRHEAFSADAVATILDEHPERDLIVHLIASHHGRARPLPGAVIDPRPIEYPAAVGTQQVTIRSDAEVDWDQPARFATLNARFGPWGLALLEAVVRLADIGCSAEGS